MAGRGNLVRLPPRSNYQEKENPPDGDSTWLKNILGPAQRETLRFLQDLAHRIEYKDYLTLSVQAFSRCRALALSDEFEEIEDESLMELLRTRKGLEHYRALPEYTAMRQQMREMATALYSEHDKDGKDWLESNKAMALREMVRLLRDGADTSPGASKLMSEMVERVLPAKASRTGNEGAVIRPTPEFLELLQNALEVTEKAKAVDKKEGAAQDTA